MWKISFFLVIIFLFGGQISFAQDFPESALILEKALVKPNRQLVLWMTEVQKNPREPVDEIYTCPEQTRGHYYSGKAFVSLVDVQMKKVINTLQIQATGISGEENTIDLPYLIKKGYYKVPKVNKNQEGKPLLLDLKDYNADGKANEFALFEAIACMGLETTLIGYSEKQDRVIQYQIELTTADGVSQEFWIDYLFGHKPDKNNVWKYEIDYRGRGGALETYEIRYNLEREMFYGTRKSFFDDESENEKERPNK